MVLDATKRVATSSLCRDLALRTPSNTTDQPARLRSCGTSENTRHCAMAAQQFTELAARMPAAEFLQRDRIYPDARNSVDYSGGVRIGGDLISV
jgi:hypothetical protein